MSEMDERALEIAHAEILRLRDRQAQRISSVRGRSAAVLGASGLAASLVSAVGANPWYTLSIICFVLATIYAVKSMSIRTVTVTHPVGVLSAMIGVDAFGARVAVIKQVRKEYDRAEASLTEVVNHLRTSMNWFVAGAASLILVSGIPPLVPIFSARG